MAAFTSGGEDWQPLYRFLKDALSVNVNVNIADAVGTFFTDLATAMNNMTVQMASSQQQLNDAISKIGDTFGVVLTTDRLGSIIFAEGWESGMGAWGFSLTGDSDMWVSRQVRKSGLQSLCCMLDADFDNVYMWKYMPYVSYEKVGFEMSVRVPYFAPF